MVSKITAEAKLIAPGEQRNINVDFKRELEDIGDSLTGTPTAAEISSSDLTLANTAVGTSTYTDADGYVWTANKYVGFTISGQQDDTDYLVKVTVTTDAATAETIVRNVRFLCRDR